MIFILVVMQMVLAAPCLPAGAKPIDYTSLSAEDIVSLVQSEEDASCPSERLVDMAAVTAMVNADVQSLSSTVVWKKTIVQQSQQNELRRISLFANVVLVCLLIVLILRQRSQKRLYMSRGEKGSDGDNQKYRDNDKRYRELVDSAQKVVRDASKNNKSKQADVESEPTETVKIKSNPTIRPPHEEAPASQKENDALQDDATEVEGQNGEDIGFGNVSKRKADQEVKALQERQDFAEFIKRVYVEVEHIRAIEQIYPELWGGRDFGQRSIGFVDIIDSFVQKKIEREEERYTMSRADTQLHWLVSSVAQLYFASRYIQRFSDDLDDFDEDEYQKTINDFDDYMKWFIENLQQKFKCTIEFDKNWLFSSAKNYRNVNVDLIPRVSSDLNPGDIVGVRWLQIRFDTIPNCDYPTKFVVIKK